MFVKVEGAPEPMPRTAQSLEVHPRCERDDLMCIMSALRVPRWWDGKFSEDEYNEKKELVKIVGGWKNASGFMSFAEARAEIVLRIVELGLSAELVWAFPSSHSTWEADASWRSQPFQKMMDRFRSTQGA
jgi:hypothetical protein